VRNSEAGLTADRQPPASVRRVGDRIAWWASAFGLERWARLGAVAVIPLLLPSPELRRFAPLFSALAAYVLLTALARRNHYLRAADLLAAAVVIAVAGPQVASFLPFVLVAIAGPASRGGPRAGAAAGMTLALLLIVRLAIAGDAGLSTTNTVSLALLLPLTGLTTAAAMQVLDDRSVRDRMVLQEANRLLTSLRDLADDLPGGLDVSTVGAALVAELRQVPGVRQAIVYAEDLGVHRPVAVTGLPSYLVTNLRVDVVRAFTTGDGGRLVTPHQLPEPMRRACESSLFWSVQPLGEPKEPAGILFVGFEALEAARSARPQLASIAKDGAIALDNARLFDGTRVRAVDAARRQVAADLHDGVAQSLAHLRMELELLARQGSEDDEETARLARVASSALAELRRTIRGLDTPVAGDLAALLTRHLDDLRTVHGPTLELETSGTAALSPERCEQALRVAQEAISNALRHAEATTVTVSLERDEELTELVVEDDGVGLAVAGTASPNGGVGLRSMRERAERLDGRLTVREPIGGGTVVTLRFPTHPSPPDHRRGAP
jgi:signal transduction histidine kinase